MTRIHWALILLGLSMLAVTERDAILNAAHDAWHSDPPDAVCFDPCMASALRGTDYGVSAYAGADMRCASECYGRVTWTVHP